MTRSREEALERDASALYGAEGSDADADALAFAAVSDDSQPALARLSRDLRNYRASLLAGFDERREVLEWSVGALGATLGRLPPSLLEGVHQEFIKDSSGDQRPPLLGGLLGDDSAVPNATARAMRERLAASAFTPAASQAVRTLRGDAQEIAPSREGPNVDPSREQHAAMRPSLSAIEEHQRRATEALLEGFADVDELLSWGDVLELATHGELPNDYLASVATSPTTRSLLLVENPDEHRAAREVIGAWLLRYYARGTRSRYRHSAEVSDPKTDDSRAKQL